MKSLFDKQLLSPVRLHQQPESVVEIVSAAMREELGSVQADQNLRLSVGETARVMQVLDKSTGRIACDSAGQTGFVGVVDHPREGLMVVRGRGKQVGESVKADGRFTSNHGDILFQIQTHKAGLREAEAEYFRLVEGAGWEEATQATLGFEEVIRTRVRELRDDGKPVMYVTEEEVAENIQVAPFISRVIGRAAMQIGAKMSGQMVGKFGEVVNSSTHHGGQASSERVKPVPKIAGLIEG